MLTIEQRMDVEKKVSDETLDPSEMRLPFWSFGPVDVIWLVT